jgi:acetoacetyl-CoA synthetase
LIIKRFPDDSKIALYCTTERFGADDIKTKTFGQLRERVKRYAASLKKMGVTEGDRVVGYIPNCAEAIEAMAATASIGAIWSSTSPDFGVTGVLDRFSQIQPKVSERYLVPAL